MANEIEVGAILEGKVTGITKFGAFVSLPGGKSGLVHISEIAYSYVSDVNEPLSEGQEVKVKVISVDENNRINLSIKRVLPPPARNAQRGGVRGQGGRDGGRGQGVQGSRPHGERDRAPAPRTTHDAASKEPKTFDAMLKQFMSDSDSKLSGRYTDKSSRRRNNGRRG